MADRQIKVVILGDATSLQGALGGAEASTSAFSNNLNQHVQALQTVNTMYDQNGQALSRAEQRYAEAQLASGELKVAERDVAGEARSAAAAFGALGESGGKAFERVSALGGVMGGSGALGLGIGAALIGGGAIIEMSHSMIENADRNEEAQRGLAQAFDSQGKSLDLFQSSIDEFLSRNTRFISSQYEAKDAIASLTRAGFDWETTQRLINDALDLSAAKNISLGDATKDLVMLSQGQSRALLDLGISMKNIEDPAKGLADAEKAVTDATRAHSEAVNKLDQWEYIHANRSKLTRADLVEESRLKVAVKDTTNALTAANQELTGAQAAATDKGDKFNQALDQLEPKISGSREKISDLKQAQNDLGASWDKLSNDNGPALEEMLAKLADATDNFLKALGNQQKWDRIDHSVVTVAKDLQWLANGFASAIGAGGGNNTTASGVANNPAGPFGAGAGPATRQGNSGRGPAAVTINVNGSSDPQATARMVSSRLAALIST